MGKSSIARGQEPPRSSGLAHWDYLLKEMKSFHELVVDECRDKRRKFKAVALGAVRYTANKESRELKKKEEEDKRLKAVAKAMAYTIESFWSKIERILWERESVALQMMLNEKKRVRFDKFVEEAVRHAQAPPPPGSFSRLVDRSREEEEEEEEEEEMEEEMEEEEVDQEEEMEEEKEMEEEDKEMEEEEDKEMEEEEDKEMEEEDEEMEEEKEMEKEEEQKESESDFAVEISDRNRQAGANLRARVTRRTIAALVTAEEAPPSPTRLSASSGPDSSGPESEFSREEDGEERKSPEEDVTMSFPSLTPEEQPVEATQKEKERVGAKRQPSRRVAPRRATEVRRESTAAEEEEEEEEEWAVGGRGEMDEDSELEEEDKEEKSEWKQERNLLQEEAEMDIEELRRRYATELQSEDEKEHEEANEKENEEEIEEENKAAEEEKTEEEENKLHAGEAQLPTLASTTSSTSIDTIDPITSTGSASCSSASTSNTALSRSVKVDGSEAESRILEPIKGSKSEVKLEMPSSSRFPIVGQSSGNLLPANILEALTEVPFLIRASLREYQREGLHWLVSLWAKNLNGILADEMGLGKTLQTICIFAHMACAQHIWGPHLVVAPTSVILNWEMEFKRFCPAFKVLTYYGSQQERQRKRQGWNTPFSFHVCIASYAVVVKDAHIFRRKPWYYMVLDEAQNIKSFQSKRWQTLLTFNTVRRILLTGTPLQNSLEELWSLMHFLMPHVFSSHSDFKEWFGDPLTVAIEKQQMDGQQALVNKLHAVLRPYLLRRLKKDVEKQMPFKYEHVVKCNLTRRQRTLYDEFMSRRQVSDIMSSGNYHGMMNVLMQLRKVCNHPDLFEPRPVTTAFWDKNLSISMDIPSLVCVWLLEPWNWDTDTAARRLLSLFCFLHYEIRSSRRQDIRGRELCCNWYSFSSFSSFSGSDIIREIPEEELSFGQLLAAASSSPPPPESSPSSLCYADYVAAQNPLPLFRSVARHTTIVPLPTPPYRRYRGPPPVGGAYHSPLPPPRPLQRFRPPEGGFSCWPGAPRVLPCPRLPTQHPRVREPRHDRRWTPTGRSTVPDERVDSGFLAYEDRYVWHPSRHADLGEGGGAPPLLPTVHHFGTHSTMPPLSDDALTPPHPRTAHVARIVPPYSLNNSSQAPSVLPTANYFSSTSKPSQVHTTPPAGGSQDPAAVVDTVASKCNSPSVSFSRSSTTPLPVPTSLRKGGGGIGPTCVGDVYTFLEARDDAKARGFPYDYMPVAKRLRRTAENRSCAVSGVDSGVAKGQPRPFVAQDEAKTPEGGQMNCLSGGWKHTRRSYRDLCAAPDELCPAPPSDPAKGGDSPSPLPNSRPVSGGDGREPDYWTHLPQHTDLRLMPTCLAKTNRYIQICMSRAEAVQRCNRWRTVELFARRSRLEFAVSPLYGTDCRNWVVKNLKMDRGWDTSSSDGNWRRQTNSGSSSNNNGGSSPNDASSNDESSSRGDNVEYQRLEECVWQQRLSRCTDIYEMPRNGEAFLRKSFNTRHLCSTAKERADKMKQCLSHVLCICNPRVLPKGPRIYIRGRGGVSGRQRSIEWQRPVVDELSRSVADLHSIELRRRCLFPHRMSLQEDCGKLVVLAGLMKRLKAGHHRCLLFTQFSKMLDVLENFINLHGLTYVRLDGSTKVDNRQRIVTRFNENPRIFLFISSTRAGGVGLNLTGADTVIFYDTDWNPAMDRQAMDRCHRIGQTRDVHVYRLVCCHSIEENIWRKQLQKRQLDDIVVDQGKFTSDWFSNSETLKEIFSSELRVDNEDIYCDRVLHDDTSGADADKAKRSKGAFEMTLANVEDADDVQALQVAAKETANERAEFVKEFKGEGGSADALNDDMLNMPTLAAYCVRLLEENQPPRLQQKIATMHDKIALQANQQEDEEDEEEQEEEGTGEN